MAEPNRPQPTGSYGADRAESSPARDPARLRSQRWFAPDDLRSFGHRSRLKGMGFDDHDFRDRPIVAILNTWNELVTCHSHFRERVADVKRGIFQAGGFPVEVPVLGLSEMLMKPTTMLYRNLLAMEVEEVLRSHPIDAAVLMGGCDKTVPGLLMGALSANVPSIFLPAGPMLKAYWDGEPVGSGTDVWKYWNERQAGNLCQQRWNQFEGCIARSAGTCMSMGTASTMACVAEAMGWSLPGAASVPAVSAEHHRLAAATGRLAVQLAWEGPEPVQLVTAGSLHNAVTTLMAIGGSTNAIVHLIALAGRAGIRLRLEDFDRLSARTPVLANLKPAGEFLMEDFHLAGGLPALLQRIEELLDPSPLTVLGGEIRAYYRDARSDDVRVIADRSQPLSPSGGLTVLSGNLAPDGAILKTVAADPRLLQHRGPAVVFEDYADLKRRLDDPAIAITPESVLVLRSAGPVGAPGFPEWGMLPIPKRLLEQGVRDMLRISDARMSGTSFGTCVLHVSPESQIGGPLALVADGDMIRLDTEAKQLHWEVSPEEEALRRARWSPPKPLPERGYAKLFAQHVRQADLGCDFDFLEGPDANRPPDIF
jgi:dihydroxy-acid dehydratase